MYDLEDTGRLTRPHSRTGNLVRSIDGTDGHRRRTEGVQDI